MKYRSGDRRGHRRFEILGTFVGSLETWRPHEVQNLSLGGALVKLPSSYQTGTSLRGRVIGHPREMRASVRHVTPVNGDFLVGLEFSEPLSDLTDLGAGPETGDSGTPLERRRYRRVAGPPDVGFELCSWTTVELNDVSMGGAMFTSNAPFELGSRARFRTRFGDRRFDTDVEITRLVSVANPGPAHGLGARFVSMDRECRQILESFLVTADS